MTPPRLTALLKVTKSPSLAPWFVSVTVIVVEPLVAENVVELVVEERTGVISLKLSPSSI